MGSFAGFLVSTQQGRCLDHRPVPLLHQLLRSAYVYGYVPSPYEQQYVPIVWLPDAVRAVQAVVERSWSSHSLQNSLQQGLQESRIPATASYHMYHVSSLNVNLNQAANEISLLTGAPVGYRQQSDGDKMEARPTKSTAQAAIDQEQQKLWRDGVKSQGKKKRDDEDEDDFGGGEFPWAAEVGVLRLYERSNQLPVNSVQMTADETGVFITGGAQLREPDLVLESLLWSPVEVHAVSPLFLVNLGQTCFINATLQVSVRSHYSLPFKKLNLNPFCHSVYHGYQSFGQ